MWHLLWHFLYFKYPQTLKVILLLGWLIAILWTKRHLQFLLGAFYNSIIQHVHYKWVQVACETPAIGKCNSMRLFHILRIKYGKGWPQSICFESLRFECHTVALYEDGTVSNGDVRVVSKIELTQEKFFWSRKWGELYEVNLVHSGIHGEFHTLNFKCIILWKWLLKSSGPKKYLWF
jgi:hypothetical protein